MTVLYILNIFFSNSEFKSIRILMQSSYMKSCKILVKLICISFKWNVKYVLSVYSYKNVNYNIVYEYL